MIEDREALERAVRARCDAGEYEGAATLVIRGYGRELLGFLVSRLRDTDEAGEVFSDFAEDLWRGLAAFEWRCSMRSWAYTLARHATSRHLGSVRRHRKRHVALSDAPELSRAEKQMRTATLAALRTATKTRIAALRERLPPDDRDLLVLRVNRKLDWREIAHVLLFRGESLSDEALDREAARLRKRFQIVKERLRQMATDDGLLGPETG
jgi:RNA polymerase sigma-70 factor (ECF subfamily)